jgi:putative transcriptional regulator
MNIRPGTFIKSTVSLNNSVFKGAVILITEYNAKGAMGFVINKPFTRKLNELAEFSHIPNFPLYEGGPVDKGHLFFIHQRPDIIKGGDSVSAGIFVGGDFTQAVSAINNYSITESDIKIFIGYCGWDYAELEEEIEEGSWEIADITSDTAFV